MENPYTELTHDFNRGRLRAILSSGQAVVLYRLAIMSKDGDWILREDEETLAHVRGILAGRGARYRFGAPLDLRWLRHGWSAHFEFRHQKLRIRTDFVTRPPRISPRELGEIWRHPVDRGVPVVGLEELAELKKTDREKDYAVIGELARQMRDQRSQFLYSRSALDLIRLAREHPRTLEEAAPRRPLLARVADGRDELERALDDERRALMRVNEERLERYQAALRGWSELWPRVAREVAGLPLGEAHEIVAARAADVLPFEPGPGRKRDDREA